MTTVNAPRPSATAAGRGNRSKTKTQRARLELRVQPGGDHAVVRLWGEMDADTIGDLVGTADTLAGQGCVRLVLDLSRVYTLDADSVAELVKLRNLLIAHGGDLWLAAPRPWVRRTLEHMGHTDTFNVQPTVAAMFGL